MLQQVVILTFWPLYSPHSFVEICPNMCPKELFQIRCFSSAFVTCIFFRSFFFALFFLIRKRHIPKPYVSLYHFLSFQKILTKMFYWDPKIFIHYPGFIWYFQVGFRTLNFEFFFCCFLFIKTTCFFVVEWSFWINKSDFYFLKY